MGAGVPSGLQNRFEELSASQVGSIPTYSRQRPAAFADAAGRFFNEKMHG